ncbi:MAG: IclR family transcriptional regulator [Sphaerochaetaceae bacterium]|nr:IclR family transcriptional regulator [Sphaerochaetaceae bacterium]
MTTEKDSYGKVPAVDRTIDILEYLLTHKQATVKEIAEACRIPSASASRLIKTLTVRGYLNEHKGAASTYSLGLKFLQFAQTAYQNIDIETIAKEEMQRLSAITNQTSQFAVLDNDSVMYTQVVFPNIPVSIVAPLRTPIAVNLSAAGKILCGNLDEDAKIAFIQKTQLVQATDKSIVDKLEFLNHVNQAKKLGYACDMEEFSQGIGCVAAPIFDHTGKAIAAIGITGQFATYSNPVSFERLKNQVLSSASAISAKIGAST